MPCNYGCACNHTFAHVRSDFLFGYKRYPFNRFYHLGARRLSATGRRAIYRRIVSNRSADFGGRQSQKVCFRLSQWWGDTIAATSCRTATRQETSPNNTLPFKIKHHCEAVRCSSFFCYGDPVRSPVAIRIFPLRTNFFVSI